MVRSRSFGADFHPPSAYRFSYIFEGLPAHIFEGPVDLSPDLPVGVVRQTYAARIGNIFQPCGDVDALSEDVVVVDDDVADVNADAKFDPPLLRRGGILLRQPALNLHRAAHRIDGAGEFDQHAVACGLDDAAPMGSYRRVN